MHIFKNRKWNLKFTIQAHPHKAIEVHVKKCIKNNKNLKDLTTKLYKKMIINQFFGLWLKKIIHSKKIKTQQFLKKMWI
jgi:hypothetical protein